MKKGAVALIVSLMLMTIVFAKEPTKVSVVIKTQTIQCNGEAQKKLVIQHRGTTYVPLRELGNMLKVSVSYKDDTIIVGSSQAATSVQSTEAAEVKAHMVQAEMKYQHYQGNNVMGAGDMIIYNGTTYMPLRTFGKIVDTDISYENGNIIIGTVGKKDKELNQSTNQTKPVPLGTEQLVTVKSGLKEYSAKIKINEVLRGDEAWSVLEEISSNKPAQEGKEYVLVNFLVEVVSVQDEGVVSFGTNLSGSESTNMKGAVRLSYYDFIPYSNQNTRYESQYVKMPYTALQGIVKSGEQLDAWGVYVIDEKDTAPKLLFGYDFSTATGGTWFSLS